MPTTQPRLNVVVERPLLEAVEALAKRDGMSVSHKARDLLLHAVTLEEDFRLEVLVRDRKKNRAPSIPHEEFWKKRGIK